MESKICAKCDLKKTLNEFHFRKDKNRHITICRVCQSEYNKKYIINNNEKIREDKKKWNEINKERVSLIQKEYNLKNKSKRNARTKTRKKEDLLFNLNCKISRRISGSFKSTGRKKNTRTVEILGCTVKEFKIYLESKFESWMNWENHGNYSKDKLTWQLDHIIPSSSAKTENELIKLNHFTNFQPLESMRNILKSNKII